MKPVFSDKRLIKEDYMLHRLESLGVPKGVLISKHPKDITTLISTLDRTDNNMSVKSKRQISWYNKLIVNPYYKNYLLVLAANTNDSLAYQAGLRLFCSAYANSHHSSVPIWHRLDTNYKDDLRDSKESNYSSIFISNITLTSSNIKLEKCRDILDRFSHIPRIIMLVGMQPFEFCRLKIFIQPDMVIWMDPQ